MIRASKYLILVGSLFAVSVVHAAASGTLNTRLYWDKLTVTPSYGASISRASYANPPAGLGVPANLSADSYSWWSYEGSGFYYDDENGETGTDPNAYVNTYSTTHTSPEVNAGAGYDALTMQNYSYATVTNDSLGWLTAESGSHMGLVYYADTDGIVTISLDYTVGGSVSTENLYEYASVGYEIGLDAIDLAGFLQLCADNGGDADAASDATSVGGVEIGNDNWLIAENGSHDGFDMGDTLSLEFEVQEGKYYYIGAEAQGWVDTVTPVPVPGVIWLFGSGLAGLVAVGRRKRV